MWDTPPFVATIVGDRLYGRGSSDDKGGFAVHLAALRAFGGRPPVGVTLFVEGEEEIGSPTLAELMAEQRDALAADVFVIADSTNWTVGVPGVHHHASAGWSTASSRCGPWTTPCTRASSAGWCRTR